MKTKTPAFVCGGWNENTKNKESYDPILAQGEAP
jgi:hypothetical protein